MRLRCSFNYFYLNNIKNNPCRSCHSKKESQRLQKNKKKRRKICIVQLLLLNEVILHARPGFSYCKRSTEIPKNTQPIKNATIPTTTTTTTYDDDKVDQTKTKVINHHTVYPPPFIPPFTLLPLFYAYTQYKYILFLS